MRRRIRKSGAAIMAAALLPAVVFADGKPGAAAAAAYQVDGIHSSVMFRVKHLNVSYFYGRFNEISGSYTIDEANLEASSFDITVNVASLDTNSKERDQHMLQPEFFDAEKHKTITFKSTKVKRDDADELEVTGELTLRGVTRTIKVEIELTGAGPDPWGAHRSGFETIFTIKRSDFGMAALPNALGDEVKLFVSVEGKKQKENGAN